MVNIANIAGCCAARTFFRVGGAEAVPTYKNQEAFDKVLYKFDPLYVNIIFTNDTQDRTRQYLATGGWKTEKVGHLWVSTISSVDFMAYKKKLQVIWNEEKRVMAAQREALPKNTKKKITLKEILDITARDDTRRYRTGYSYVEFNDVIRTVNKKYGINIPINRETRNWSYHSLHNSVVRRVYNKNK